MIFLFFLRRGPGAVFAAHVLAPLCFPFTVQQQDFYSLQLLAGMGTQVAKLIIKMD